LSVSVLILDFVTGTGVLPAWVVPPAAVIDDVLWVARAARKAPPDSVRLEARGAAVAWVLGSGAAPVTGRTDTPVTSGLASAELWAALVVCDRRSPPPREDVCLAWGVQYAPPLTTVSLAVGDGVARTLGWLLGTPGLDERPMQLPWRDENGRVLTAEELYADALAHRPERFPSDEQRLELWRWVHEAGFSAAAAEWIEATKRRTRGRAYESCPSGRSAAEG